MRFLENSLYNVIRSSTVLYKREIEKVYAFQKLICFSSYSEFGAKCKRTETILDGTALNKSFSFARMRAFPDWMPPKHLVLIRQRKYFYWQIANCESKKIESQTKRRCIYPIVLLEQSSRILLSMANMDPRVLNFFLSRERIMTAGEVRNPRNSSFIAAAFVFYSRRCVQRVRDL